LDVRKIRNAIGISEDNFCLLIGVSKNRLYREEVYGDVLKDYEKQKVREIALEIALSEIKKHNELVERLGK
jgi:hypothetical protein